MVKYVAMWNLPGCLPEMEPATFDNTGEAWTLLAQAYQEDERAWVPENPGDPTGPHKLGAEALVMEARAKAYETNGQSFTGSVRGRDGYIYSVEMVTDNGDEDD